MTFASAASNLVAGDSNGADDVFVHDRVAARTTRTSTDTLLAPANGSSGLPDISGDGHYVAFGSFATNLDGDIADTNGVVDVYVRFAVRPEVSSISPASLARGTIGAAFSVSGHGFLPGVVVLGGGGVTFDIDTLTENQITGTVTVAPSAATGPRDAFVGTVGSGPGFGAGALGRCASCLTVT